MSAAQSHSKAADIPSKGEKSHSVAEHGGLL
jgi:hypothetical protein